ncbi:MAG: hypothetical protein OES46_17345 [Gammaproteobacteria bacterium]|nr:hypothetical protein [Gammaproteobacteria bacterium]
MSTFDKACPECGVTNSVSAIRCTCGYLFNPLFLEDPHLALELAILEERLIEEYLTARAEQAEETAMEAAQTAAMYPENQHIAVEAVYAAHNARKAKAEFAQQRARAARAEAELKAYMAELGTATKTTRSWQSVIVTEALRAKGAQEIVPPSNESTVDAGVETPSATFRAAQAAKATEAVKVESSSSDIDLARRLRRSGKSGEYVKPSKRR